ncbi:MAG: hypothetical protein ACQERB_03435 [Promethearchaeati archaeon]
MKNQKKVQNESLTIFWGFILIILGAIGVIQIGLLEGLTQFIIYGGILFFIGIVILSIVIFVYKDSTQSLSR